MGPSPQARLSVCLCGFSKAPPATGLRHWAAGDPGAARCAEPGPAGAAVGLRGGGRALGVQVQASCTD